MGVEGREDNSRGHNIFSFGSQYHNTVYISVVV